MNKDLEFIKDKLAQSEIKAPEDMDKSFVMNTLSGKEPIPQMQNGMITELETEKKKNTQRKRRVFASIAAAIVLVGALGVAISVFFGNRSAILTLPGGLSVVQFNSNGAVKDKVNQIRKDRKKEGFIYGVKDFFDGVSDLLNAGKSSGGLDGDYLIKSYNSAENSALANSDSATGSTGSSSGGSAADSHSETYKQVEGVDEADIIKTDGRYIYCLYSSSIYPTISVFTAEGEDSKKVAEIYPSGVVISTRDEVDLYFLPDNIYINDFYLKDNRLTAICSEYNDNENENNNNNDNDKYSYGNTRVIVYDVSDIENITVLDSMVQSGIYTSSRMIDDTLYTVSSYTDYGNDIIPRCGNGTSPDEVPADCIYSLCDPTDESFLIISAYDTLNYDAQTLSKAILGDVDDIYCNEENMYIYSTAYNYEDDDRWYDAILGLERKDVNTTFITTQILKVDLTDDIGFTAYAEVDGYVKDQYSFDEYDGNLRVATTNSIGWRDSNNVFILDEELSEIGSVTGFAKDEEIKSVRYVGDTAYVITYRQTDPLFVIDLSKPTDPQILGEVEITGFSSMLVPIDENTILGLGAHIETVEDSWETENGFKLALFDVSDKSNPKVLDSKSYVDYYSAVMYNPKALVYNPERGDFVIPINYEYYGGWDFEYNSKDQNNNKNDEFYGGVLNFKIENGKIIETDLYRSDCESVDRCVYVGDTVYMTYLNDDLELDLDTVKYK